MSSVRNAWSVQNTKILPFVLIILRWHVRFNNLPVQSRLWWGCPASLSLQYVFRKFQTFSVKMLGPITKSRLLPLSWTFCPRGTHDILVARFDRGFYVGVRPAAQNAIRPAAHHVITIRSFKLHLERLLSPWKFYFYLSAEVLFMGHLEFTTQSDWNKLFYVCVVTTSSHCQSRNFQTYSVEMLWTSYSYNFNLQAVTSLSGRAGPTVWTVRNELLWGCRGRASLCYHFRSF